MNEGWDTFFNLSNELMCYFDSQGFIERVNPAWAIQLGWSREDMLGKPIQNFTSSEDQYNFEEVFKRATESHTTVTFENRIVCKDMTWRWLAWNIYYFEQENKFFALSHDITSAKTASEMLRMQREDYEAKIEQGEAERKQIQQQLILSQLRFHELERHVSHDAVILLDAEGRIIQWSSGAERLLGYNPKEIIGEYFSKFYQEHEIWNGKHHHAIRQARSTGVFEDTGILIRKDGTSLLAYSIMRPYKNEAGRLGGFVTLLCGRSNKSELDGHILIGHKQVKKKDEANGDGVFIAAPNGFIRSCNQAFALMLGYQSQGDVLGKNLVEFYNVPGGMNEFFAPVLKHQCIDKLIIQLHDKCKTEFSVIASAQGVFDGTGECLEIHVVISKVGPFKGLIEKQKDAKNSSSMVNT